jgi:2-methylcitrate dehydratase PrpD
MAETIARQLAGFIEECDLDALPPSVVLRTKLYIMDTLGATLAGVSTASSRIVTDLVEALGGREECTVVGHAFRTSPTGAALANGTIGHAVEIDDDHRTSVVHPGVAVVPAALAMTEHTGAGGKALLEGVVAGYEIMTRIGDAFLGKQYYEGFNPTGPSGVFGAAAAASRVLGLTGDRLVAAFGIAGTQAAGLQEWKSDGSWIKRLNAGKAAESGVLATMLAARGFTGPDTIIEGKYGYLKAFSFERKWDAELITRGLGTEFRGYGTSFKPYACCRFAHQLVDAVLEIVREGEIWAEDIEESVVRIYRTGYEALFEPTGPCYRPRTMVDAQFSIPYIVAVAIFHGRPLPHHFTDQMIADPKVLALAARIKGVPDDEFETAYPERYPTEITIRLKDGRELTRFNDLPSGDPTNPIYADDPERFNQEIEAKFRILMATIPEYEDRTDTIIARIAALDKLETASDLARLFTPNGKASTEE